MMQSYLLGKVITDLIDHRGRTPKKLGGDFSKSGVPVISANNVKNGRLDLGEGVRYVTSEMHNRWMPKKLRVGDVLLTSEAPLGEVAYLRDQADYCLGQRLFALRADPEVLDSRYLYYLLLSPPVRSRLLGRATGTTAQGIRQSELVKVHVDLPPLHDQRAIAHILGTLDDKIELNRRMNRTLEEMARALFTSWFVTFDPVRAKAAGRQPEGMDAATAALFPDEFSVSEIGEIPFGWSTLSLDSIARFTNGLALQKYPVIDPDPGLPVIKIAQLRKGSSEGSALASSQLIPDFVVHDGDVLFSWSGSLELVIWTGGKGALNQHLFKVTSNMVPQCFYYFWIDHHLPWFREIAASKATTMGHIQRRHLTEARVAMPPPSVLKGLSDTIDPILARVVCNSLEAHKLAPIRDDLLPALLSGALDTQDAEAFAIEPLTDGESQCG